MVAKRRIINKIISITICICFLANTVTADHMVAPSRVSSKTATLAPFLASQSPFIKSQIKSVLLRHRVISAVSNEAKELLFIHGGPALLLDDGTFLVDEGLTRDDYRLIRAITHERTEALMQILAKRNRAQYEKIMNFMVNTGLDKICLEFIGRGIDDMIYEPQFRGKRELVLNHIVATIVEWYNFFEKGYSGYDDIRETYFYRIIRPLVNKGRELGYFSEIFFNAQKGEDFLRMTLNRGFRFEKAAANSRGTKKNKVSVSKDSGISPEKIENDAPDMKDKGFTVGFDRVYAEEKDIPEEELRKYKSILKVIGIQPTDAVIGRLYKIVSAWTEKDYAFFCPGGSCGMVSAGAAKNIDRIVVVDRLCRYDPGDVEKEQGALYQLYSGGFIPDNVWYEVICDMLEAEAGGLGVEICLGTALKNLQAIGKFGEEKKENLIQDIESMKVIRDVYCRFHEKGINAHAQLNRAIPDLVVSGEIKADADSLRIFDESLRRIDEGMPEDLRNSAGDGFEFFAIKYSDYYEYSQFLKRRNISPSEKLIFKFHKTILWSRVLEWRITSGKTACGDIPKRGMIFENNSLQNAVDLLNENRAVNNAEQLEVILEIAEEMYKTDKNASVELKKYLLFSDNENILLKGTETFRGIVHRFLNDYKDIISPEVGERILLKSGSGRTGGKDEDDGFAMGKLAEARVSTISFLREDMTEKVRRLVNGMGTETLSEKKARAEAIRFLVENDHVNKTILSEIGLLEKMINELSSEDPGIRFVCAEIIKLLVEKNIVTQEEIKGRLPIEELADDYFLMRSGFLLKADSLKAISCFIEAGLVGKKIIGKIKLVRGLVKGLVCFQMEGAIKLDEYAADVCETSARVLARLSDKGLIEDRDMLEEILPADILVNWMLNSTGKIVNASAKALKILDSEGLLKNKEKLRQRIYKSDIFQAMGDEIRRDPQKITAMRIKAFRESGLITREELRNEFPLGDIINIINDPERKDRREWFGVLKTLTGESERENKWIKQKVYIEPVVKGISMPEEEDAAANIEFTTRLIRDGVIGRGEINRGLSATKYHEWLKFFIKRKGGIVRGAMTFFKHKIDFTEEKGEVFLSRRFVSCLMGQSERIVKAGAEALKELVKAIDDIPGNIKIMNLEELIAVYEKIYMKPFPPPFYYFYLKNLARFKNNYTAIEKIREYMTPELVEICGTALDMFHEDIYKLMSDGKSPQEMEYILKDMTEERVIRECRTAGRENYVPYTGKLGGFLAMLFKEGRKVPEKLKHAFRLLYLCFGDGEENITTGYFIAENCLKHLPLTNFKLLPADPPVFERKSMDDIPGIDKGHLDTLLEGAELYKVMGRTAVYKTRQGKYLALKFLKYSESKLNGSDIEYRTEDPGKLVYENEYFGYLNELKKQGANLRSEYPRPVFINGQRVVRVDSGYFQEDMICGINRSIALSRKPDEKFSVDSTSDRYTIMAYEADTPDYFTYLHEEKDDEKSREAFDRNLHDLCVLARFGIVHPDIIDMFHTFNVRKRDKGIYFWMNDVIQGTHTFLGAGRLSGWENAIKYSNMRVSGNADFAEMVRLDDLVTLEQEHSKYLKSNLNRFPVEKRKSYLMAHFIGNYLLAAVLTEGKRLKPAGKLVPEYRDKLADRIRDMYTAAYTGLLGEGSEDISLLVDWDMFARQMIFFMGGEYKKYAGKNVPEGIIDGLTPEIKPSEGWGFIHREVVEAAIRKKSELKGIDVQKAMNTYLCLNITRRERSGHIYLFRSDFENLIEKESNKHLADIMKQLYTEYSTGWRFNGKNEDLGTVNGPFPLQELIKANYIYTTAMVARHTVAHYEKVEDDDLEVEVYKPGTDKKLGKLELNRYWKNPVKTAVKGIEQMEIENESYKRLILEILKLFENSPPKLYTFNKLVKDLYGFSSPEHNFIVLHKDFQNDPIALLHELMEYVIKQGKLEISILSDKENLIVSIDGIGNFPVNVSNAMNMLKEDGEVWVNRSVNKLNRNPHYLLRILQREIFMEEDVFLTKSIKKKTDKRICCVHHEDPDEIEDLEDFLRKSPAYEIEDEKGVVMEITGLHIPEEGEDLFAGYSEAERERIDKKYPPVSKTGHRPFIMVRVSSKMGEPLAYMALYSSPEGLKLKMAKKKKYKKTALFGKWETYLSRLNPVKKEELKNFNKKGYFQLLNFAGAYYFRKNLALKGNRLRAFIATLEELNKKEGDYAFLRDRNLQEVLTGFGYQVSYISSHYRLYKYFKEEKGIDIEARYKEKREEKRGDLEAFISLMEELEKAGGHALLQESNLQGVLTGFGFSVSHISSYYKLYKYFKEEKGIDIEARYREKREEKRGDPEAFISLMEELEKAGGYALLQERNLEGVLTGFGYSVRHIRSCCKLYKYFKKEKGINIEEFYTKKRKEKQGDLEAFISFMEELEKAGGHALLRGRNLERVLRGFGLPAENINRKYKEYIKYKKRFENGKITRQELREYIVLIENYEYRDVAKESKLIADKVEPGKDEPSDKKTSAMGKLGEAGTRNIEFIDKKKTKAKVPVYKPGTEEKIDDLKIMFEPGINPVQSVKEKMETIGIEEVEHKTLLDEILSLYEHSPPKLYTFDKPVKDLYGFPAPEYNLIVLYKDFQNDPIALLHELMEYAIKQGKLEISILPDKENLIVSIDGIGNFPVNVSNAMNMLKEDGEVWVTRNANKLNQNPHYLLRILQREIFMEEDVFLTKSIKKKTDKRICYIQHKDPEEIEDLEDFLRKSPRYEIEDEKGMVMEITGLHIPEEGEDLFAGYSEAEREKIDRKYPPVSRTEYRPFIIVRVSSKRGEFLAYMVLYPSPEGLKLRIAKKKKYEKTVLFEKWETYLSGLNPVETEEKGFRERGHFQLLNFAGAYYFRKNLALKGKRLRAFIITLDELNKKEEEAFLLTASNLEVALKGFGYPVSYISGHYNLYKYFKEEKEIDIEELYRKKREEKQGDLEAFINLMEELEAAGGHVLLQEGNLQGVLSGFGFPESYISSYYKLYKYFKEEKGIFIEELYEKKREKKRGDLEAFISLMEELEEEGGHALLQESNLQGVLRGLGFQVSHINSHYKLYKYFREKKGIFIEELYTKKRKEKRGDLEAFISLMEELEEAGGHALLQEGNLQGVLSGFGFQVSHIGSHYKLYKYSKEKKEMFIEELYTKKRKEKQGDLEAFISLMEELEEEGGHALLQERNLEGVLRGFGYSVKDINRKYKEYIKYKKRFENGKITKQELREYIVLIENHEYRDVAKESELIADKVEPGKDEPSDKKTSATGKSSVITGRDQHISTGDKNGSDSEKSLRDSVRAQKLLEVIVPEEIDDGIEPWKMFYSIFDQSKKDLIGRDDWVFLLRYFWEKDQREQVEPVLCLPESLARKIFDLEMWMAAGMIAIGAIGSAYREYLRHGIKFSEEETRFLWQDYHLRDSDRSNTGLKFINGSLRKKITKSIRQKTVKGGEVNILDLGCGSTGQALKDLKEKYPDKIDKAVGISIVVEQNACTGEVELREEDIRVADVEEGLYDVIYESKFLEDFNRMDEFELIIKKAMKALRPGGVFFIGKLPLSGELYEKKLMEIVKKTGEYEIILKEKNKKIITIKRKDDYEEKAVPPPIVRKGKRVESEDKQSEFIVPEVEIKTDTEIGIPGKIKEAKKISGYVPGVDIFISSELREYISGSIRHDVNAAVDLLCKDITGVLEEGRSFVIRYNKSRLENGSFGAIEVIKGYMDVLNKRFPNSEFKAIGVKRKDLILTTCHEKDTRAVIGEGYLDVRVPEGNLNEYYLRIVAMINITIAASVIPSNAIDDDSGGIYDKVKAFIERQCKAIMGEAFSSVENFRRIVLMLPKADKFIDAEQVESYKALLRVLRSA